MNTSTDFIGFSTVVVEKLSRSRIPPPNSGSFDSVRLRLTTLRMTILFCSHSLQAPAVYGAWAISRDEHGGSPFPERPPNVLALEGHCFLPHRISAETLI